MTGLHWGVSKALLEAASKEDARNDEVKTPRSLPSRPASQ